MCCLLSLQRHLSFNFPPSFAWKQIQRFRATIGEDIRAAPHEGGLNVYFFHIQLHVFPFFLASTGPSERLYAASYSLSSGFRPETILVRRLSTRSESCLLPEFFANYIRVLGEHPMHLRRLSLHVLFLGSLHCVAIRVRLWLFPPCIDEGVLVVPTGDDFPTFFQ